MPSLLIFLLFGKITARVIFLSAVSGFSGSWAVTNSDMGCAPRLTRPVLYKQAYAQTLITLYHIPSLASRALRRRYTFSIPSSGVHRTTGQ
jgi:hypothetical protein